MADSLSVQKTIRNATSSRDYGARYTVTRSASEESHGRKFVGTTEEAILVPSDINNLGVRIFTNHDDTNFVEVGHATGVYTDIVMPGQSIDSYGPLNASTFYVKADTAACDFEWHFFSE